MARQQEHLSSVYNAIRILQAFSDDRPELGITEISTRLGLAKSTVFRLMRTLTDTHLLVRDPETRRYRLGLGTFVIGSIAYRRMEIRDRAFPLLVDLMQNVRRVVRLGVYDDGGVVYLCKLPEDKETRTFSSIGKRVPPYCTAVGKLLLAFQPDEEVGRILSAPLRPMTGRTITDPDKLRAQFVEIRHSGYATTFEESTENLCSVAVPVYDRDKRVMAAISVTGTRGQFLPYQVQQYLRAMRATSQRITDQWDGT